MQCYNSSAVVHEFPGIFQSLFYPNHLYPESPIDFLFYGPWRLRRQALTHTNQLQPITPAFVSVNQALSTSSLCEFQQSPRYILVS